MLLGTTVPVSCPRGPAFLALNRPRRATPARGVTGLGPERDSGHTVAGVPARVRSGASFFLVDGLTAPTGLVGHEGLGEQVGESGPRLLVLA